MMVSYELLTALRTATRLIWQRESRSELNSTQGTRILNSTRNHCNDKTEKSETVHGVTAPSLLAVSNWSGGILNFYS